MPEKWISIKTSEPIDGLPVMVEYLDGEAEPPCKIRGIATYYSGLDRWLGLEADEIGILRWKMLPLSVYKELFRTEMDWKRAIVLIVDLAGQLGKMDSLELIRNYKSFEKHFTAAKKNARKKDCTAEEYIELLCTGEEIEKYYAEKRIPKRK